MVKQKKYIFNLLKLRGGTQGPAAHLVTVKDIKNCMAQ